jgi:DNA-binding transcriptional MerR regulator
MQLDVAALARQAGLSVDTIRYYQGLGLLHAPRRDGRNAVYDASHVERLERIRTLAERGFSLKAIGSLLEAGDASESDRQLLEAVTHQHAGRALSSEELAERLGVPAALIASVERTGLAEGQLGPGGSPTYSEDDVRIARGALKLLEFGFPLTSILTLAVKHDRNVRRTVDQAIDLFDDCIRKPRSGSEAAPDSVAKAYREILPLVTALVAHHFQRVLVNRALGRLKKKGDEGALERALRETSRRRIGFRWS